MGIGMLLEMAVSTNSDRVLVGDLEDGLTGAEFLRRASAGAAEIVRTGARHVAFVGVNAPVVPVTVFAAAAAGVPMTPLNYRLSGSALRELIGRLDKPLLVGDPACLAAIGDCPDVVEQLTTDDWLAATTSPHSFAGEDVDDASTAVMLFTSGTTSAPKGVLLRHANLVSYVLQTVEFGGAAPDEASLTSVPPYHVAGMGTVLTNLYAGRRLVYLPDFTAEAWLRKVADEEITSAMLVPTMLARIVDHLGGDVADAPTLRTIAYGGARLPRPVLERALRAFPDVDFTNAYGLTETSSTISVLGPEDHRTAVAAPDPAVRSRLSSAGRFVPGMEGQIRDEEGNLAPQGEFGELWVRGAQVSGEYEGLGSVLDDDGWFPTRDRARIDDEGYLFVEGRADDTIIRGGENIAPAEIEEVLLAHPDIVDAAVFAAPDEQWGDRIVAMLVLRPAGDAEPERFRSWVRERLRSSRTPDQVLFASELPYTATGKLLRRELVASVTEDHRP